MEIWGISFWQHWEMGIWGCLLLSPLMAVLGNGDLGLFSAGKWGFGGVHCGSTGKWRFGAVQSWEATPVTVLTWGCAVLIPGGLEGVPSHPKDSSLAPCPPDTIRKMKVDFRHMEAEMDDLAANMAAISASSARVSAALQERHRRGAQLAGTERGGHIRGCSLRWGQIWGQRGRWHARVSPCPADARCPRRGAGAAAEAAGSGGGAGAAAALGGHGAGEGPALPRPCPGRPAPLPPPALLPSHRGREPRHHGRAGPAPPRSPPVRPPLSLLRW